MHKLPDIRVRDHTSYCGLTVFPLFAPSRAAVDYVLSDEAMAEGSTTVTEISEAGSVPELQVHNDLERSVLFLEGEALQGAKQNRILNTSVLIGAGKKTRIPVSCVEQGRWSHRSAAFRHSGHHSSPSLRHLLKKSVHQSTRETHSYHSDQGEVWSSVRRESEALGVRSPTGAMSAHHESHAGALERYRKQLPYVEGAAGLVVAVGERIVFLDLFDRAETMQKTWDRLLSGAVLEAFARKDSEAKPPPESAVREVWDRVRSAAWTDAPAVGDGREYRCAVGDDLQASSVGTVDDLVHCSATVHV